jgi:hypothetical protein
MTVRAEADNKDDEIRDLLIWLRNQLGPAFVVTDYWEADRSAIGVAKTDDPKQLVYISSRGDATGEYFVELEAAPDDGSEFPYAMVGRFHAVDRQQLLQIVSQHLHTGPSQRF